MSSRRRKGRRQRKRNRNRSSRSSPSKPKPKPKLKPKPKPSVKVRSNSTPGASAGGSRSRLSELDSRILSSRIPDADAHANVSLPRGNRAAASSPSASSPSHTSSSPNQKFRFPPAPPPLSMPISSMASQDQTAAKAAATASSESSSVRGVKSGKARGGGGSLGSGRGRGRGVSAAGARRKGVVNRQGQGQGRIENRGSDTSRRRGSYGDVPRTRRIQSSPSAATRTRNPNPNARLNESAATLAGAPARLKRAPSLESRHRSFAMRSTASRPLRREPAGPPSPFACAVSAGLPVFLLRGPLHPSRFHQQDSDPLRFRTLIQEKDITDATLLESSTYEVGVGPGSSDSDSIHVPLKSSELSEQMELCMDLVEAIGDGEEIPIEMNQRLRELRTRNRNKKSRKAKKRKPQQQGQREVGKGAVGDEKGIIKVLGIESVPEVAIPLIDPVIGMFESEKELAKWRKDSGLQEFRNPLPPGWEDTSDQTREDPPPAANESLTPDVPSDPSDDETEGEDHILEIEDLGIEYLSTRTQLYSELHEKGRRFRNSVYLKRSDVTTAYLDFRKAVGRGVPQEEDQEDTEEEEEEGEEEAGGQMQRTPGRRRLRELWRSMGISDGELTGEVSHEDMAEFRQVAQEILGAEKMALLRKQVAQAVTEDFGDDEQSPSSKKIEILLLEKILSLSDEESHRGVRASRSQVSQEDMWFRQHAREVEEDIAQVSAQLGEVSREERRRAHLFETPHPRCREDYHETLLTDDVTVNNSAMNVILCSFRYFFRVAVRLKAWRRYLVGVQGVLSARKQQRLVSADRSEERILFRGVESDSPNGYEISELEVDLGRKGVVDVLGTVSAEALSAFRTARSFEDLPTLAATLADSEACEELQKEVRFLAISLDRGRTDLSLAMLAAFREDPLSAIKTWWIGCFYVFDELRSFYIESCFPWLKVEIPHCSKMVLEKTLYYILGSRHFALYITSQELLRIVVERMVELDVHHSWLGYLQDHPLLRSAICASMMGFEVGETTSPTATLLIERPKGSSLRDFEDDEDFPLTISSSSASDDD